MAKRLEKIVEKQLDNNQDAVNAMSDKYISSFECFRTAEEKDISEANLNIQKILSDIANRDSDEVIKDVFDNIQAIEESRRNLDLLDRTKQYLLEEIKERVTVQGLNNK